MTAKKEVTVGRGHKSREDMIEETRPERISVANQRNKLTVVGQDPGRSYRHVNDNDGGQRLHMFEEAGYRIETDKTLKVGTSKMSDSASVGSAHRTHVGTDKEGNAVYAYLMSIKMDWYLEDQLAKQLEVDSKEKGISDQGDYGTVTLSDDGRKAVY